MVLLEVSGLALLAMLGCAQRGVVVLWVQLGSKVLHVCVSCRVQCDIEGAVIGATGSHAQPAKHAQQTAWERWKSSETRLGNFGERLAFGAGLGLGCACLAPVMQRIISPTFV